MSATPLVTIAIPAYNERYFGEALASAVAQRGVELEILVCDDSPGEGIGRAAAAVHDARLRYVRNPTNLGFGVNFTRCFELARGAFVKFLNDDDRLRPGCVATFAAVLDSNPAVKLATSRRLPIDEGGNRLPDGPATAPLALVPALMAGRDLGDFALANTINFIGEPTTVMFRRADVVLEDGRLFRWGGRDYHCLADMSLWLRLLAQGHAYYSPASLSEFRIHAGQEQHREGVRMECFVERLWIHRQARAAGFLAAPEAQRAALAKQRARAAACVGLPVLLPREQESLRSLLADLDGEIASLR